MPTFATYTLGCKVNQAETARIEEFLSAQGYRQVDFKDTAEHYIINTCSVTHVADRKSRTIIRQPKKRNPRARVIVTGCSTPPSGDTAVDLYVPNTEKSNIEQWKALFPSVHGSLPSVTCHMSLKVRRTLKVQEGCTTFCSYCIVPHVRTGLWSLPLVEIMDIVERWVLEGTREIVLTGINLGLYRDGDNRLRDVIRAISTVPELLRIRISSLELPHVTAEFLDEMVSNPKVCHHLHLPLQSGSNAILRAMRRPYSREQFLSVVQMVRERLPDIGLTTDIIVGFPGETEQDFQGSEDLIREASFSKVHVFKYSVRPGTPAATFPEQVDPQVSQDRSERLISLGNDQARTFAKRYLNEPLEVLFEEQKDGFMTGLSGNYVRFCTRGTYALGTVRQVVPRTLCTDAVLTDNPSDKFFF